MCIRDSASFRTSPSALSQKPDQSCSFSTFSFFSLEATRFQIRIKVLDSLANSRDFRNLLKAYNRAASKLKKEKVENCLLYTS